MDTTTPNPKVTWNPRRGKACCCLTRDGSIAVGRSLHSRHARVLSYFYFRLYWIFVFHHLWDVYVHRRGNSSHHINIHRHTLAGYFHQLFMRCHDMEELSTLLGGSLILAWTTCQINSRFSIIWDTMTLMECLPINVHNPATNETHD